jgi:phosphoglycerate dehydrogenase-like enzyme
VTARWYSRSAVDTSVDNLCGAILGVGEVDSRFAADLVARGVAVRAWDPASVRPVAGVRTASAPAEAVAGAARGSLQQPAAE